MRLDGWMAGWLDGWMAGGLDGWMAGWLEVDRTACGRDENAAKLQLV